jgi:CheY-like chemotaxis protein
MRASLKRHFGSDLATTIIVLIMSASIASLTPGFNLTKWSLDGLEALSAKLPSRPTEVVPVRPNVLLASAKSTDRFSVATTVEPRGYTVLTAASAESALRHLREKAGQIGIVVVDSALPNAQRVVDAVPAVCPGARPIILTGERRPAQVAALLISALNVRPAAPVHVIPVRKEVPAPVAVEAPRVVRTRNRYYELRETRVTPHHCALLSLVFMMGYVMVFDNVMWRKRRGAWAVRTFGGQLAA